jgi:trigger factor
MISTCRRRWSKPSSSRSGRSWSRKPRARGRPRSRALKEIEAEKDDYRAIAVRRVRLGLLLSEIGQANNVEVSKQEMQMLMHAGRAAVSPGRPPAFVEYVQQDPMAAAQLRAPLYEDKVVDFLFDKAEVTEREVTAKNCRPRSKRKKIPTTFMVRVAAMIMVMKSPRRRLRPRRPRLTMRRRTKRPSPKRPLPRRQPSPLLKAKRLPRKRPPRKRPKALKAEAFRRSA